MLTDSVLSTQFSSGDLENSQEEAFIEDDYTTSMYTSDFSVKEDQDIIEDIGDLDTGDMMPVQDQMRLTYDEELADNDSDELHSDNGSEHAANAGTSEDVPAEEQSWHRMALEMWNDVDIVVLFYT